MLEYLGYNAQHGAHRVLKTGGTARCIHFLLIQGQLRGTLTHGDEVEEWIPGHLEFQEMLPATKDA